jgi:hypothetical protein
VEESCSRSTTAAGGDEADQAERQFAQVARVFAWMRQGKVPPTVRPGTPRRRNTDRVRPSAMAARA